VARQKKEEKAEGVVQWRGRRKGRRLRRWRRRQ
jgi:hypothetical protein